MQSSSKITRRRFLSASVSATSAAAMSLGACCSLGYAEQSDASDPKTDCPGPARIKKLITEPVKIRTVDLVAPEGRLKRLFIRVVSTDGDVGVAEANGRLNHFPYLLKDLIIPNYLGQDARNVDTMTQRVYIAQSNYKSAGMPFWNSVANVQWAVLDMLARMANCSVGELFGPVLRKELDVYVSRFDRTSPAEKEVAAAARSLEQTGASAVKLKVGLCMSNSPQQTARDRKMVAMARKTLGDDMTIYVDANGSYTADEAIELGRFMQDYNVAFFEEPCRWQEFEQTKTVADALTLPVAGGEQDSSLAMFRWMTRERAVDIVQPDMFYNGGMCRNLQVAAMARDAGIPVTPHSPHVGNLALPNLHFASIVPNIGPFQEYKDVTRVRDGKVRLPETIGLGTEAPSAVWNGKASIF